MYNPLTQDGRQVVLGSMMGDGYLEITHTSRHARFRTIAAERYRDYIFWKHSHLRSLCTAEPRLQTITREDGRLYNTYGLHTRVHSMFTRLRHFIYPEGKRIASGKMLNLLQELGVATWICDDGYLRLNLYKNGRVKTRALILHIERYAPACCDVIRRWFKQALNINARLSVHNFSYTQKRPLLYLYIGPYDAYNILRPMVARLVKDVPSMQPKIDFHYLKDEGPQGVRVHKPSQSAHQVIRTWLEKHPHIAQQFPEAIPV